MTLTLEHLACKHRGPQQPPEQANTCSGPVQVEEIYACSLHGKCTLHHQQLRHEDGRFYAVCGRCLDRSPPVESVPGVADITVDSATGGKWDTLGGMITRAGLSDSSGFRRLLGSWLGTGDFDNFNKTLPIARADFDNLSSAFRAPGVWQAVAQPQQVKMDPGTIHQGATSQNIPRNPPTKKLTIGMAFYEKSTEVIFTVQALRMMHPAVMNPNEAEIVLIDNKPDGAEGQRVKQFIQAWVPNARYVPFPHPVGTSAPRDHLFQIATGNVVVCMDAHVFIQSGCLNQLVNFFDDNPQNADLLHGPMLADNLQVMATQFDPVWRAEMYGIWGNDPKGANPNNPAFEIPMCGLGVFACRRDAWLGFPAGLKGFGGEEGMIHEKFRQADKRVMCLPFFRWWHYFGKPQGIAYPLNRFDKVRNYLIWARHLEISPQGIFDHFEPIMGETDLGNLIDEVLRMEGAGV